MPSTLDIAALSRGIATHLRQHRSALAQEAKLTAAVASALTTMGITYTAEHRLTPKLRLDYMLPGGVFIELKKGNAGLPVLRQVGQYLEHPDTNGCILIALKCTDIPATFCGKPIEKIELWRMLL